MSAPQYEPCVHRPGCGLAGVHHEWYDTPCERCEEDDRFYHRVCIGLVTFAFIALAVWLLWGPK